ncbi:hypothetical protein [Pelomonas sp. SE-A7]|uniref:hypothetical protein n=1 Tax=Pelomonas sp. SE-A7 TaxID=3054953 RepID=UPI00259C6CC5|nr:hypothetical protein [Pelomonas sp. SE-A7]MDM4767446.1 hypothetical protein [Pelomonas sp. SE-A7]
MSEGLALSRHALARRQSALADLRRYLAIQEQDYQLLRATLFQFMQRYKGELGPLYRELDRTEDQLHAIVCQLGGQDIPAAPRIRHAAMQALTQPLPPAPSLPAEPGTTAIASGEPLSLKQLYRRAAMRLHPDRAPDESIRAQNQLSMVAANAAYARADRHALETLLIAAGEDAALVSGPVHPRLAWLRQAERMVQDRLSLVQQHRRQLQDHPLHRLWEAVSRAETKGLRPLTIMANRLRTQISERRRELYIGQRLHPASLLAQTFLAERRARLEA